MVALIGRVDGEKSSFTFFDVARICEIWRSNLLFSQFIFCLLAHTRDRSAKRSLHLSYWTSTFFESLQKNKHFSILIKNYRKSRSKIFGISAKFEIEFPYRKFHKVTPKIRKKKCQFRHVFIGFLPQLCQKSHMYLFLKMICQSLYFPGYLKCSSRVKSPLIKRGKGNRVHQDLCPRFLREKLFRMKLSRQ